jgi:hypothetical protein
MPQINISEIGEIDVHFADVLKELSSIQFIFCLQFIKTYVDCVLCLGEFYKKFCHFPFLKNQDLRYQTKWTEFLKDLLVRQFEDYSLVDTY